MKKRAKRKEKKCSAIIPLLLSLSFSLLFSYVLIIDHHLLFLFDHAISLIRKNEKLFNKEDCQKSSSDSCVTREIAVVVEITIQMMNSFSYKYIQKEEEEKKTYTCRLSNKRVQQIQTNKRKKMRKKMKICPAKNEHVVTINFQSCTYDHMSIPFCCILMLLLI